MSDQRCMVGTAPRISTTKAELFADAFAKAYDIAGAEPVKAFAVYDLPTYRRLPAAQGATFILWHAGAILEAIQTKGGDAGLIDWETVDVNAYITSNRL